MSLRWWVNEWVNKWMNELKVLHVAHIGFTVLCIFWKFLLIKSQKLVGSFQKKIGEYIGKKNVMLSKKSFLVALLCSDWGVSR